MSGHSKWATTKHRKGAQDAKRSALFSKLSRNITVAAKLGGDPLPENNASLAAAVAKARMSSMPKDRIKAAIDKAFGAGADAAVYSEVTYEGYGPAGVDVALVAHLGALVLDDDGDGNRRGVLVRIPVGEDVEPGVERRDDADADGNDDGHGIDEDALEIAFEDVEGSSHVVTPCSRT